ncbi:tetratricopeptide repeat protein [Sphingobium sp.]|uniref:tetratricopeptide repeat protein n=1 Tax=Sphingobium sp. TaxID=1912891 RepID=UPI002C544DE8|nr:tetratricopeptide repeat protein [Sphingobium sp.]HUD90901.1 tetratricopeptide repeat protein [Sphingobium sp.]
MKKVVAILGLAMAVAVPMTAQAADDDMVVVALPDGSLAADALIKGQFRDAIGKLQLMRLNGENDPARLINLGNAYAGVGRMERARAAYRAASFAPEETLLLANGEEESSRTIAQRALGRLNPQYAAR